MKNILYIGNNLSSKGKTETTIETLSKLLRFQGHAVFVSSNKSNKLWRLFDMLFAIIKYSKKADYVLIDTYSTSNFYYAYLSSLLCQLFKLKYMPILHGGNLPNRLKTNPKLSKTIFSNSFKNITPSNYIKTEFEKYGYTNIVCIPNSIEIDKYPFKQRDFQTIKLLWVRSFSEIYNPLLAIKILKGLQNENIKASLCMVGPDNDGSLLKAKNFAKTLNVAVTFTGKLSKTEWISLSQDYNIFINTTNFDNMPVSVIEAMALGLSVISTNVGGLPFLINNEIDGVLVNPNNETDFIEAIKKLQSNIENTQKITLNARNKVANFDWNIVKNLWISVLE
ncbi:glycosyltransferase family 4 protein [Mariniflexile jejuense]|uniref:Glycosyltransferase family 4 protein n=1 Tax=Mariniflexile jejuense TaxID=1173582 RepID=A0ABW3JI80_9FLAO